VFASNYNESTNTITAIEENGSYDFSGDSGEKFVNDNDTNLVIYGSTIDDIR
jgi:hypothetical protein